MAPDHVVKVVVDLLVFSFSVWCQGIGGAVGRVRALGNYRSSPRPVCILKILLFVATVLKLCKTFLYAAGDCDV